MAPRNWVAAGVHLALAVVVGSLLPPMLSLVPGQPALPGVLVALFAVALPALTYMLLAGMWLLMLVAGKNPLERRS